MPREILLPWQICTKSVSVAHVGGVKHGVDRAEHVTGVLERRSFGVPDESDTHHVRTVGQRTAHGHHPATALLPTTYIHTPSHTHTHTHTHTHAHTGQLTAVSTQTYRCPVYGHKR